MQILKPSKIRVEADESNPNKAHIIIEPLDRGFGYTLGNALRRVLLSSMSGCAIVEARLDNVLHEYTAIEGVKEDVTNILLNLKDVAIAMHARDTASFTLKKKGPGIMVAGDIEVGHDGEVINPSHVIAHLSGEVEVGMTIKVMRGRGYQVSSEINAEPPPHDELMEGEADTTVSIGALRLDASFSPVRRVAYTVQSARVEKRTDLDKLTMELETNGTMTPQQALSDAAGILIDQFSVFAPSRPAAHETTAAADGEVTEEKREWGALSRALLNDPIEKLGLSQRSVNRLKAEHIHQIGTLVGKSEMDLLKTPSFGQKSLAEVQAVLTQMELTLGMDVGDWTPSSSGGGAPAGK